MLKHSPRNVNIMLPSLPTAVTGVYALLFVLPQHHRCQNTTPTPPWTRLTPPLLLCWSLLSPGEPLSGRCFVFPFHSSPLSFLPRFHSRLSFSSGSIAAESKRLLKGQLCCWFSLSRCPFINASIYLPPAGNLPEGLLMAWHGVITLSASLQMPLQYWSFSTQSCVLWCEFRIALQGWRRLQASISCPRSCHGQGLFCSSVRWMPEIFLMFADAFVQFYIQPDSSYVNVVIQLLPPGWMQSERVIETGEISLV